MPVVNWSLVNSGAGYITQLNFIQFLDGQGIAWTYEYENASVIPTTNAWPLFETSDCTGTAYVPRFPARVGFALLGVGFRAIPDNAAFATKSIMTAKANAQCSTIGPLAMPVVDSAVLLTVTPPSQFPGVLPIHPELPP